MGSYLFEEIQEENLLDVLELYNHYVQNTICTFHSKPLTIARLREIIFPPQKKYKTFIVLDEQKFCGYVLLSQHKKREDTMGQRRFRYILNRRLPEKGWGVLPYNI